jgi:hypothetical protein
VSRSAGPPLSSRGEGGREERRSPATERSALRLILRLLRHAGEFVLALVLLFEEWGWRPLAELLGRLARFALWARLEARIAALPPYAALCVFAVPGILFIPVKFLALNLIATGHVLTAALLFAAAKILSTALLARIFALTQPRLMQIGWFAYLYNLFVPWKEALFAYVRASWAWRYGRFVKAAAKAALARVYRRLRPHLLTLREAITRGWQQLQRRLRRA